MALYSGVMSRWLAVAFLFLAVTACDEETKPVDIPFEGIEPVDPASKKPKPAPDPSASASASAGAAPVTVKPGVSAMQACCGALYARSRSAADEGTKRVNRQAASVCSGLATKVAQGKMTKAQALAQVRSSLLGAPPSACR